jgi:hypothetical protein
VSRYRPAELGVRLSVQFPQPLTERNLSRPFHAGDSYLCYRPIDLRAQVLEATVRGAAAVIAYGGDGDGEEVTDQTTTTTTMTVNGSSGAGEILYPRGGGVPGWVAVHGSLYRKGDPSTPGEPSVGMYAVVSRACTTQKDTSRAVCCRVDDLQANATDNDFYFLGGP